MPSPSVEMPQKLQKSSVVGAWSTSEQVEELRGKLHLKERDAKAFYESAEAKKIEFERLIANLRAENKQKRINLSKSIEGDEKVIRSVFQNRKEQLLSMQRYTAEEAIQEMDQKVCEANKRKNELQHKRMQRCEKLKELQTTLEQMKKVDSTDRLLEREREIRKLQNEMDKARIKYEAARNITRRYEEIMAHMQEECRMYPARLDLLEQVVDDARSELTVLRRMKEKAIKTSEESRKDLHSMERDMYQAKRSRDLQLNETRKEVERRKEASDRNDKRAKVHLITDNTDREAAKQQQEKAERQEKILRLEEGFEQIKHAIQVSDINDVVFRVTNQENTYERIKFMEAEKLKTKTSLQEKKLTVCEHFEEIKKLSQRQAAKGRKMIEDLQNFAEESEKTCSKKTSELVKKEKLLLDLQSGIATLYEKLKNVKLKPPHHNYSKNEPIADLANCGRKLDVLLTELGLNDDKTQPARIDSHRLHSYLEGHLPPENIRIKIEKDDDSDEDDFHFDHDQDNEGLLTREDIKRLGQEMLNSKLKPKRRKTRKK